MAATSKGRSIQYSRVSDQTRKLDSIKTYDDCMCKHLSLYRFSNISLNCLFGITIAAHEPIRKANHP